MTLPLHERYPGTERLSRVELCTLPTPVEVLGIDIDADCVLVKRDDLTSPLYGGNKVRKLEFLLGRAPECGARSVITFGAYGSNHALATAVHAAALGLEPHVVLSPQPPGPYAARTLRAHAGLGSVLHPVDGWDGRREAVRATQQLAERDGVEPLVIPMGGTDEYGALGYVNAALELAEQVDVDDVYVAGGTLGTAVGLALGFAAAGRKTRVNTVRVTPSEIANWDFAAVIAERTCRLLAGADATFPCRPLSELAFVMRDEFFEPGYGVVTERTRAAVERAEAAGITLETTYTGKALTALLAESDAGTLRGRSVVFIDTYNSAPLPEAGSDEALPEVLRAYVADCDALFAGAAEGAGEGA